MEGKALGNASSVILPLVEEEHFVALENAADLVLAQDLVDAVANPDLNPAQDLVDAAVEDVVANLDLALAPVENVEYAHFVLVQVDVEAQVEVDNVELVLAQVEVDLVVAQEQVEVGNDLPEVEVGNDLPEVGAHNIVNVRRRPRRRPFSKPLSPQSETRRQESLKKKTAVKKAQTLKEARLNAPNNTGLKKAQKTAFSKV